MAGVAGSIAPIEYIYIGGGTNIRRDEKSSLKCLFTIIRRNRKYRSVVDRRYCVL